MTLQSGQNPKNPDAKIASDQIGDESASHLEFWGWLF
jgi:hypothetical protein